MASLFSVDVSKRHTILPPMLLVALVVLLTGQIVLSWFALHAFERELEPELNQKAIAVGLAVVNQFEFAVDELQIPPQRLVGVEKYFANILDSNADIEYLALIQPSMEILFAEGISADLLNRIIAAHSESGMAAENYSIEVAGYLQGSYPIIANGTEVAILSVGVNNDVVRERLSTVGYEVATVIAVSLLITLEFLLLFVSTGIMEPMKHIQESISQGARGVFTNRLKLVSRNEIGQLVLSMNRMLQNLERRYQDFTFELNELINTQFDQKVASKLTEHRDQIENKYRFIGTVQSIAKNPVLIRVPFFLFIFSEEMSRSFLPLFIARLIPIEAAEASHDFLISLPVSLFMVATFTATYFAGGLASRFGSERIFLVGIACAVIGYAGTVFTETYYQLVGWRCLTGLGYGLVFIASETWVALRSSATKRAQGASAIVGAVFVGIVCGPPIGGMFADRIGYEATFLISIMLAVFSGTIAYLMLHDDEAAKLKANKQIAISWADWSVLLTNVRMLGLLISAVATKLSMSAFLFILIPLYLNSLGSDSASIGRTLMLYGLVAVIFVPLASKISDEKNMHEHAVALGGVISAIGLLALAAEIMTGVDFKAVLIAVILMGVGHALIFSPQNAVAQQIAHKYAHEVGFAKVLSTYRLIERTGMVAGPIIAAFLFGQFGYGGAFMGVAVIVLLAAAVFKLVMLAVSRSQAAME